MHARYIIIAPTSAEESPTTNDTVVVVFPTTAINIAPIQPIIIAISAASSINILSNQFSTISFLPFFLPTPTTQTGISATNISTSTGIHIPH